MRKRRTKKSSLLKQIGIILTVIISFTLILLNIYTKKASDKIIMVMEQNLKKTTNQYLSKNISYDILNNNNLDNILVINKNQNGEILYVDYNLDRAYEALEIITQVIYDDINNIEENNGLILKVPFFIYSKNPLIATMGPKLFVKVDFVSSILTNIKSKITNYGLNNALVELFVTLDISELITSPVSQKEIVITYDILVASKVINGRVPEFYGGLITEESSNLNVPIN